MSPYVPAMRPSAVLRDRLASAIDSSGLSRMQVCVEAQVAEDTLRKALNGGSLRPTTIQRLEAWVARAEKRLDRQMPRS
jgi:hypothetical protein